MGPDKSQLGQVGRQCFNLPIQPEIGRQRAAQSLAGFRKGGGIMNRTLMLCVLWILPVAVAPLRAQKRDDAVEVKVGDMQATPAGISVTLEATQSDQQLYIMIGLNEGEAIARTLEHVQTARPMTHDLMKTILDRTGWKVQSVLIRGVRGNSYLADLVLEKDGETMTLDSRPSDAMAIAVRSDAKIYVSPELFDQQGTQAPHEQPQEATPPKQEGVHL